MIYEHICHELNGRLALTNAQCATADSGSIHAALDEMLDFLSGIRERLPSYAWQQIVVPAIRSHPMHQTMLLDPFTARAFNKPNGYPGDAVMMDFVYLLLEDSDHVASAGPIGSAIHSYTMSLECSQAVRERREHMAHQIDQLCARKSAAGILSVAAGHLREAALATSLSNRRFGRFIATDQDEASVAAIASDHGHLGITALTSGLKQFLAGDASDPLGAFDLIYATGLYDYLPDKLAKRLTAGLFNRLEPGGSLVIPNFAPGMKQAHYIEAFCDWWLVLRDGRQMLGLMADCPQVQIASAEVTSDSTGNILTLTAFKA